MEKHKHTARRPEDGGAEQKLPLHLLSVRAVLYMTYSMFAQRTVVGKLPDICCGYT